MTYARSGSTLLQALLNSCPGVLIRGENYNALFHLYRAIRAMDETRAKHGGTSGADQPDDPWFGAHQVQPRNFEARAIQAFVRRVLAPPPGVSVTGFKEIRYNRHFITAADFAPYMTFLLNRFPGARLVFNSRRAEAEAASGFVAQQGQPLSRVQSWVAEADASFAAFARANPERTRHMQYEDWTLDHGQIHELLGFLDLDWTPEGVASVMSKRLTHAQPAQPRG